MSRSSRRAASRNKRPSSATKGVDLKEAFAEKLGTKPKPLTVAMAHLWSEEKGVSGFWHNSIVKLIGAGYKMGIGLRPMAVESGPFLSRARNTVADQFLRLEDDYLLFTDTDMVFEPQDFQLLLEADAAIAGALYYTAATGMQPWCTALVSSEELDEQGSGEAEASEQATFLPLDLPEPPTFPDFRAYDDTEEAAVAFHEAVEAYKASLEDPIYQPRAVAGVGMGLTLIKRQVLEDVVAVYPKPFEFVDDRGEDLTFCLRAAEFGHETIVVPQARAGHIKSVVI